MTDGRIVDAPEARLDITAQARIRTFLREYNRRTGATVLLTSHYMADVTALCERVILIHHGQLKYDGALAELSRHSAPFKIIGLTLANAVPADLRPYGTPLPSPDGTAKRYIQIPAEQAAPIMARLLANLPVLDLTVEDPPIEDVIKQAFHE